MVISVFIFVFAVEYWMVFKLCTFHMGNDEPSTGNAIGLTLTALTGRNYHSDKFFLSETQQLERK